MRDKNYMLSDLLKQQKHKQIFTGWSGAETYYLPEMAAYLKIAPMGSLSDLRREKEVLEWIGEKLPVPKVLGFQLDADKQFILLSEIKGIVTSEHVPANSRDITLIYDFAEKAARAIRAVHDLPLADCLLKQNIDVKLAAANKNIKLGLVDETDFDEQNLGRTAQDVYEELVEKRPQTEDLVFTHGDLCLPNIMIFNGKISGFIDFDRGGISDRYQDIALFLRSFALNTETSVEIGNIFCRAYGIDALDQEKIYYYRLLDELF